ncbi:4-hydroxy-tetrahydrodipicolinate reductase [Eupransor demetentiae]|uniref:4-hydroxy-tetrahydrodipicolinate reductase n=1 Tax=Eupransor demetentiae TaxID=3109584 RepID=A0ABP0EQD1_9LACO|nr:4-hydroxy-tetrahydrodipicolinate reductase (DapB) [Lactobacillaceae bacterium LMG 33000]
MVKVLVAGFTGAMGQAAVNLINSEADFELVGLYAPSAEGKSAADYDLPAALPVYGRLAEVPANQAVWLDFTTPAVVYENIQYALKHGYTPLVGTSGLKDDEITNLQQLAHQHQRGGLIVPNFGLSAVLLMKFAREAAQYLPDVEIIEMHHEDKKDAPSGTALATAKLIDEVRPRHEQSPSVENLPGVRGGDYHGIRVHAVRLPGYLAHEEVLFGGPGEALSIRQDSFDRASFMQGIKVALEKIGQVDELLLGLEQVL